MAHVLIVDDRETDRYLLRSLLEAEGFEVEEAEQATDAMARGRKRRPDLLISDVLMPDMDGFQLCRAWRSDPALSPVPLLLYTASYIGEGDRDLALDAGADAYLVKPVEPGRLLAEIRELLDLGGRRRGGGLNDVHFLHRHKGVVQSQLDRKLVELEASNRAHEREEIRLKGLLALHEEAASLDDEALAQRTVELAEQATDSTAAYLHHIEDDGRTVRLVVWSARTFGDCRAEFDSHYPLDRAGLWADCARVRQPVIHNEIDPAQLRNGLPSGHVVVDRHMAVPVMEAGKPVMILGVGNREEPYTQADAKRLRIIAESTWSIMRRRAAEARSAEYLDYVQATMLATVDVVSSIVEMRDPYTSGHERRVAHLSRALANAVGLSAESVERVAIAALVHDVGKLAIPAEILTKPGRLTPMEREIVRTHSRQGFQILKKSRFTWPLAEIVLQHHERWDGSGYPDGLAGEDIRLEARILAVADVVEAMASHRPHRPGRPVAAALTEIENNAGTLYDPAIAAACLRLFQKEGYRLPDA